MKVITANEMTRLDSASKVPSEELMERAGRGLADFITDYLPYYPVCIVCGSGNNGGDGFVTARYLLERGREVEVYTICDISKLKGLPVKQMEKLEIEVRPVTAQELECVLHRKMIVVDCILGTGFTPPLKNELKPILEIINKKSKITISCDIPTGVNGNTGDADECSVDADITVTFEYPKTGHMKGSGSRFTGSLEVVNIGTGLSPEEYIKDLDLTVRQDCEEYFKRRSKESNKKIYGHVLIIGGSPGLEGAVSMASVGALRAGAGLVTCAVGKTTAKIVSSYAMAPMTLLLDETEKGYLADNNTDKIIEFIEKRKIDCVVLGPGMGTDEPARKLCLELIEKIKCSVVLDADGINNIAGSLESLERSVSQILLTPHPGEMARLTGVTSSDIQSERIGIAKKFASEMGCTVLLKGYRSVITDGIEVYINSTGNAGMACGGMGDVLSGMAGALIGQGMDVLEAGRIAAWVHGRAGDLAAVNLGQRYMLPDDVLSALALL
jgi:NAD(P)H-hydrate epimerase